jgi:hypothetical protein
MSNRFFTLGNEILSRNEYSILATAINDDVAEYLVDMLNKIDSESDEPSDEVETWKCSQCGTDCSCIQCPADSSDDDLIEETDYLEEDDE